MHLNVRTATTATPPAPPRHINAHVWRALARLTATVSAATGLFLLGGVTFGGPRPALTWGLSLAAVLAATTLIPLAAARLVDRGREAYWAGYTEAARDFAQGSATVVPMPTRRTRRSS